MACVAVASLVRTLELEFLQPQPRPIVIENELISGNKELIQSLCEKLESLMEQFDEKRMDGVEALKDLETKLRNVASRLEDEIEFQVADLYVEKPLGFDVEKPLDFDEKKTHHCLRFCHFFRPRVEKTTQPCVRLGHILQQATQDIEQIQQELVKVMNNSEHVMDLQGRKTAPYVLPTSHHQASHSEDIMVGKNNEFETIKEMLIECPFKQREAVAITGMGGIGKTTLARRIYEDLSVISHFDKRAWVVASQLHNKRKMLVDLYSILQLQDKVNCRPLVKQLYKCLTDENFKLRNAKNYTHLAENLLQSLKGQMSQLTNEESCRLAENLYQCLKGQRLQLTKKSKRKLIRKLHRYLAKLGNVEMYADEVLAEKLYQILKRQRYLIVMDDVWSKGAWDDVRACFPDDGNSSRILLTTRLQEVAHYTTSTSTLFHQMHMLNPSESWILFHEKVFSKGRYQGVDEFETIARPIVEKCKGLPLAIIVAAGLFSKLNTLDEWKNIAKALNSSATTIADACSQILSFSYNHLPHNLKACFLYLGVFPEDNVIYANNLARLWEAEGLVKASKDKSFEVVAETHIQEFVDRNLILVTEQSSNGRKVKAFRMHDVLHAFCVKKAQNENLLHVVGDNDSNFHHKDFRWLSIQSRSFDVPALYSSSKTCHSIFYFPKATQGEVSSSLVLQYFNRLRVLYDGGNSSDYLAISEAVGLVHLRYIYSIRATTLNNLTAPRSWNLQIVHGNELRDSLYILEFPQLRYFNCKYISGQQPPEFVHRNLKSISGLEVSDCTKELLTSIPCLKKLCIANHGKLFGIAAIENLVYLQQLEKLKIMGVPHMPPIDDQNAALRSLKKLTFSGTGFPWKKINVLSMLSGLEVLKLEDFACRGHEWELTEEVKFCSLMFLKINKTHLQHWNAGDYNFPKLERLLLSWCSTLKDIPSGFAEIPTWKSIELTGCLHSVVTSANQILEEQHEYGNDDMVVTEEDTIKGSDRIPPPSIGLGSSWEYFFLDSPPWRSNQILEEQHDYGNDDMVVTEEDTTKGSDRIPPPILEDAPSLGSVSPDHLELPPPPSIGLDNAWDYFHRQDWFPPN